MKWVEASKSPDMIFGHSQDGTVVVAATHYQAMTGLAVTESELGLEARNDGTSPDMVCERTMLTGTHVPRWYCRYSEEVARERLRTQIERAAPQISPSRPMTMSGTGASANTSIW
jgi:hypothetical protein